MAPDMGALRPYNSTMTTIPLPMKRKVQLPIADGYSALLLTDTQIDALRWLLDRREVQDLLDELDPYVNEEQQFDGYLGLKPIVQRVQSKIDEQIGSAICA